MIHKITPIDGPNIEMADDAPVYNLDNLLEHDWYPLNDGVMGGVSRGIVKRDGYIWKYFGQLSLENRGGFSTIRANLESPIAKGLILIRIQKFKYFSKENREFQSNLKAMVANTN